MASLSLTRACKEFKRIQTDGVAGVTVRLVDESNPFRWSANFVGPAGSPYAGGKFDLRITLDSENYPNSAPALAFETKIWHPSVSKDDGKLCEGLLADWSPTSSVKDAIGQVLAMLTDFKTPHGVLNEVAAQEQAEQPEKFKATAAAWTKLHAK